ncbi:exonuclease SbcD [Thermococcus chitonophagus]|uniref:Exonuclease SbcD n=1 Tax=Thermococcus chitonophagus TaxID=54262 RepID=A0A160VRI4_9EURY|nr:metallophosphoesterase [Thermococcus chitonophagus]ASJ16663.1 exonuclease SbcD [Thermococcus chitonophagus]CUX77412.1 exonuclease sbcd related [Thermococcus chitonophagus]
MELSLYSFEFESSQGKTLIFADPHIGFEPFRGINVRSRFERKLAEFVISENPDLVIILGDIKEDLGLKRYTQRVLMEFFSILKDYEVIITKGNHDGRIEEVTENFDNISVVDYYILDEILFMHGHKSLPEVDFKRAFLGHIHPTAIISLSGVKRRAKCFVKAKNFVILPTINPFFEGMDIREGIRLIPFLKNLKTVDLLIPPSIHIEGYPI